jgi:hypothetical protein
VAIGQPVESESEQFLLLEGVCILDRFTEASAEKIDNVILPRRARSVEYLHEKWDELGPGPNGVSEMFVVQSGYLSGDP